MTETQNSQEKPQQTFGQELVRCRFNPSGNDDVDAFKRGVADLIDKIRIDGKDGRATSLAVTHLETAAMFAVKSLTA